MAVRVRNRVPCFSVNNTKLLFRAILFLILMAFVVNCYGIQEDRRMLKVPEIVTNLDIDINDVSRLLEEQTKLHTIDLINWDEHAYRPEVTFRIAHSNNLIWLKYYVKEKSILAEVVATNGAVANDSCVEFFFDPKADGAYYNFEFSCIGTTHLAYGPSRSERAFIEPQLIEQAISIKSSLGNRSFKENTGNHTWEMTIIIPASILVHDTEIRLKGLTSRANFYKCGNKTAEAHYLSWNGIDTKRPDFHRPEFFGTLIFE